MIAQPHFSELTLSPTDIDAIADAVVARLQVMIAPKVETELTRGELATKLRISIATVDRLSRNGRITPIRAGRRCLYRLSDAVASLQREVSHA